MIKRKSEEGVMMGETNDSYGRMEKVVLYSTMILSIKGLKEQVNKSSHTNLTHKQE